MSRIRSRATAVSAGLVTVVAAVVAVLVSAVSTPADVDGVGRADQGADSSVPDSKTSTTTTTTSERQRLREAQRILDRLGYQVDNITGERGSATEHAIVAFQKVHGLSRSGELNDTTWSWLHDPLAVEPSETGEGLHIETDLTRQIAYTVRDGEVENIYDVSTGTGRSAGAEPGGPEDHSTPTGRFQVHYRIDGMEYAPLGNLYRPIYFTRTGIAFHGAQPVKPQPASHGCVRMTDASIDELFGRLVPGTEVVVYRS